MTDLSQAADTLGYPAIVPINGKRYLHNQRLGLVKVRRTDLVEERYLYFMLCSDDYRREILASASGSTVKHTSPSRILAFRASLPPLQEQRAIASVLGTLDDKIELNRETSRTLEAMAAAIFRSWFVDFDPVVAKAAGRPPFGMDAATAALFPDCFEDSALGPIPAGWRIGRLSDLCVLKRGYDLPTNLRGIGNVPVYSSSGPSGWHNEAMAEPLELSLAATAQSGRFSLSTNHSGH